MFGSPFDDIYLGSENIFRWKQVRENSIRAFNCNTEAHAQMLDPEYPISSRVNWINQFRNIRKYGERIVILNAFRYN